MKRLVLLAALLMTSLSPALFGGQSAPLARGFVAGTYYNAADIDQVNAMNGNLVINLPVGRAFTAGDRLGYQFVLNYNSSIWDYEQHCASDAVRELDPLVLEDVDGLCFTESIPVRDFNAGLGWHLAVGGDLRGDGRYISVDGAVHTFWQSPHFVADDDDYVYTRDNSYIRAGSLPTEHAGDVGPVVVELANGTSETFHCAAGCKETETQPRKNRRWDLDRIEDRFGNALFVQSSNQGSQWIWTYTEKVRTVKARGSLPAVYVATGMTHEVELERVVDSEPFQWRVRSLTLASSSLQKARYMFNYATNGSVYRDWNNGTSRAITFNQPNADPMRAPILTSLTQPAGMGSWDFTYVTPAPSSSCSIDYCPPDPANLYRPYATSRTSGRLRTVRYPTGGSIEYTYGTYVWEQKHCGLNRPHAASNFSNTGVRERQRKRADGSLDGTPFLYKTRASLPVEDVFHCFETEQLTSTSIEPRGAAEDYVVTESYFNIATTRRPAEEYSLNFGPREPDPAGGGRFLSNRVYQCGVTFNPQAEPFITQLENPSICTRLRSTYVRYDLSGQSCEFSSGLCPDQNSRVAERRTVYHDDQTSKLETYGDFDGLGHYRSTQVEGDFERRNDVRFTGVSGEESPGKRGRTTFTNFNPGTHFALGVQIGQGTLTGLPSAWVINTYTDAKVEEYTVPSAGGGALVGRHVEQAVFNADGYLARTRVLKDDTPATAGTPSAVDLITTSQRTVDSAGRMIETARSYGGDLSPVPATGPLESLSLGVAEFQTVTEIEHGVVVRRSSVDCNNVPYVFEEATVDPASGFVTKSKDTAGALTEYTYDVAGRLTVLDPPGNDANVVVGHPSPNRVNLTYQAPDGTVWKEAVHLYGDFGQHVEAQQKLPVIASEGGPLTTQWNSLTQTYGPTNLLVAESTLGPTSPESSRGYTTYKDFDAFGRAKTIVHPDSVGGDRKTTVRYSGDREAVTRVEGVDKTERYDSLGRLVYVKEGDIPATIYRYDVLDHLAEVRTDSQRRFFHYDGRGFLADERPPELDGKLWFYRYDSHGNLREKRISGPGGLGPHTPFDLTYGYDSADRPTWVTSTLTGTTLKSFEYYPYPATTGMPLLHAGKLMLAWRLNRIPEPTATTNTTDVQVVEERHYDQTTGRVESRKVRWSPGTEVETRYQYDALGDLVRLQYPVDTSVPSRTPARSLQMGYTQGLLTSVTGFASTIGYYYNGLPREVRRDNGITDVYVPDPSSMARFREIRFKRGGAPENGLYIGGYGFSERGNVLQIGPDRFSYDAASRLTSATVNGLSRTYTYDAQGNRTGSGTEPVNAATNRLAAPAQYDDAGNLTSLPSLNLSQDYDAAGMMVHRKNSATLGQIFVYDAFDERIGVIDYRPAENRDADPTNDGIRETWSLRGPGNLVLRDLQHFRPAAGTDTWSWMRDYIYRGSTQLASVSADGVRHLHTDHLGSIRRVTDGSGTILLRHDYLPFGEQVPVSRGGAERMRFTGHERDDDGTLDGRADQDYMHARYYSSYAGRFYSLDAVGGTPGRPQSWNRYAYAWNNPLRLIDPDGREPQPRIEYRHNKNLFQARSTKFDRIFFRAMGKLGLTALALPMVETAGPMVETTRTVRVVVGAVVVGAGLGAANDLRNNERSDAKSMAGAAIDGAATALIARAAIAISKNALPDNTDPDATADGIAGVISLFSGNEISMILGLTPLPDDAFDVIEEPKNNPSRHEQKTTDVSKKRSKSQ